MSRKHRRQPASKRPTRLDFVLGLSLRTVVALGITGALTLYALWMVWRAFNDPGLIFIRSEQGAEWIRLAQPKYDLDAHPYAPITTVFRTTFELADASPPPQIRLKALRTARVRVDGQPASAVRTDPTRWKTATSIDLPASLDAGSHELQIEVTNESGPPLLLVFSDSLNLHTGTEWEASADGKTWAPVALATQARRSDLAERFPSVPKSLKARLPVLALVFLLVAGWSIARQRSESIREKDWTPETVRWAILGLVGLIGLLNILRLPSHLGFDAQAHVEYVRYLMENLRIPIASEGWQLFQSPFYYLAALPPYALMATFFGSEAGLLWLRLLSLFAGLGLIEVSFRALKAAYPERGDLQILGTLFAGCLPMNLYIAHHPGNEALAGFLSAVVVLLLVQRLASTDSSSSAPWWPLGLFLGLAILTKVTAVLLIPVVLVALWYVPTASTAPAAALLAPYLRTAAAVMGLMLLVSGWYYVRNWILLGKPFMGGWDAARGIEWWQEPGYRHVGQLFQFGEALRYPLFAGTVSFLDGNYASFWSDTFISGQGVYEARPPWNYGMMAASVGLALLPTAALMAGAVTAFLKRPPSASILLSVMCVSVYALALLHHFLTVPFYCTTKSFYMLGVTPCFALLLAAGLDRFTRHPYVRPVVYGLFAGWALTSLLSYVAL